MTNVLEALQADFKLFLQALWEQLDLPSPTRAQYAIADYIQHGPKRLQIQAFRGVGKSWITGAFVLWSLFNDPEKKIMIISASKERADNWDSTSGQQLSELGLELTMEERDLLLSILEPLFSQERPKNAPRAPQQRPSGQTHALHAGKLALARAGACF